jgi:hypothetical protein
MTLGGAIALGIFFAIVALLVWSDHDTTKWLKKKKFYRYRLADIETVPVVPKETFFLLVPGQEVVPGREYRVRRQDGTTVVLWMVLWMGTEPLWMVDRIDPPKA